MRALLAEACDQATKVLQGTQIHLRVAKELTWTPAKQFSLTGTSGSSKSIQVQLLFTADWPQAAKTTDARRFRRRKLRRVSTFPCLRM